MDQHYNAGTVMALLPTDYVTPITRKVLTDRLNDTYKAPQFFSAAAFELLSIVCDCLVAQDTHNRVVNIASSIDKRLHDNTGDGWRYNTMPPDREMYVNGLQGIEET